MRLLVLLALLVTARAEPDESADAGTVPAEPVPPDAAKKAEYVRLHQEIASLAEKDHWEGVEHAYIKAVATGVPLAFDDQMAGASAALVRGDVAAARERFQAARALHDDDPGVIESLWALDTSFALVILRATPGAELTVAVVPFQPDQAHAIEFAAVKVLETGQFDGYLPSGRYELAGVPFEVVVREIGADPIVVDAITWDKPPKKKK